MIYTDQTQISHLIWMVSLIREAVKMVNSKQEQGNLHVIQRMSV